MSAKILLGLIGAPGAGKDVIADFLVKSRNFRHFAFADKVKEGYYAASGFSEEQFKAARGTELEQTIRDGLWEFSDQMRAEYGNLHFITPVMREIVDCPQSVVVSDVRTPDELAQMRSHGAIMMHVFRDPAMESASERIPGTRIVFGSDGWASWLLFWNYYDSVESLRMVLPDFFECYLKV
jgi:hypothetical protein